MINEIKEGVKGSRPSWDEYFMSIASAVATRAACHHVRGGCVIVLDKRIIGTGYNGAPPGIKNCLEVGCRKEKLGMNYKNSLNMGLCVGVHAEMNALANLSRLTHKGSSVYVTIFPCHACAKTLLAYNISRIVYKRHYDSSEFERTVKLLEEAGVSVEKLDLSPERLTDILFNHPNVDFDVFSKEEKERLLQSQHDFDRSGNITGKTSTESNSFKNVGLLSDVKVGRYRHFKGQLYEVFGVSKHSETKEEFVIYRALYGDYSLWVRPKKMFLEIVEHEGKMIPRFEFIGS